MTINAKTKTVVDALLTDDATTESNFKLGLQDITTELNDTLNEDTSFGGDVSGTYNAIAVTDDSHTHDTRYFTETEINSMFAGTTAITGYNNTNWDTAYGWGNHGSEGYLTSVAFSNIAGAAVQLSSESFSDNDTSLMTSAAIADYVAGEIPTNVPTTTKQTQWDTAYNWGNHASAGYLTSDTYTGTVTSVGIAVPTGLSVSSSPITTSGTMTISFSSGYSIPTTTKQTQWDTAYGWGNHGSAGYLTSYTETDTLSSVVARGSSSTSSISIGGFAPTVRYDTNASGSVTITDYQGYYDFEIGVAGGTLVESAMVLDANWVGDTNATKNNCRFGLSVIQGNLQDTGSVIVSTTPAGHGDTIVFGNLQHNSNGTTDVVNGLSINGSVINIGSTISGATIKLKNSTIIEGSLSKASGSFKIDHPLESKTATHHLVHSFVESPTADNIYRGKVDLIDGTATVNIDTVAGMTDGTFAALNREVQCFTSNESGWIAVKGSVVGNTLTITAQFDTSTDTISWLVIGERKDTHMYDTEWTDNNGKVIVEPEKES